MTGFTIYEREPTRRHHHFIRALTICSMVKFYKSYSDCKTVGELRQFLKQINADWMPANEIPDDQQIPEVSFGGNPDNPELTRDVGKLDLRKTLVSLPSNPFLVERWKDHGIEMPEFDTIPSVIVDPVTLKPLDVKKAISEERQGTKETEK